MQNNLYLKNRARGKTNALSEGTGSWKKPERTWLSAHFQNHPLERKKSDFGAAKSTEWNKHC
jgi:hypothetical protein